MTIASHTHYASTDMETLLQAPLQILTGFFFAFRFSLIYIGFQSDPRMGTFVSFACSALLMAAAVIYTLGDKQFSVQFLLASRTMRWLLLYLAVSFLSLLWTGADSTMIAAGYWAGMAMDVATVLLLVKQPRVAHQADAIMKGFVLGVLFIAVVAWLSPVRGDLRIGDEEFLHPNGIGLHCALAFFLAQHLALKERGWKWCCLALGITLLRSISKTSIVAFLIAETFFLLRDKQISRRIKIKIAAAAVVVIAAFGTLLEAYFEIYTTTAGDQFETLTGRTVIWSTSLLMGLERPWLGHGIYSYRALIPMFGTFQPQHAHDELLQQFFEYGIFGVCITIGLYLSLLLAAKRSSAHRYGKLAAVIAVFCLIHGLADTVTFGFSLPVWLFAALALTLTQAPESLQEVDA